MTNKEHIKEYMECEKNGVFDKHINPVDESTLLPVDSNYEYIKSAKTNFIDFFKKTFIINPFAHNYNKKVLRTQIIGRENLKGIKGAIVTCNHIFMFDCLAIKKALKPSDPKFVVAKFNNFKGKLGNLMRAQGILPISDSFNTMKLFNKAIEHYINKGKKIVIYPEQSMWYMYEKPRPYKDGAFHYSIKLNVPIIPLFITLRNSGRFDEEGLEKKYFTVNIGKPIYPNKELSKQDNIKYLMNANFTFAKNVYEKTYGKKLKYTTKEKE